MSTRSLLLLALTLSSTVLAAPFPTGVAGESWDLELEGGARIVADAELGHDALLLDGVEGSYARCPAPEGLADAGSLRIEVKVRLDQFRASSIPIAWPGRFMVYLSGEGKPWLLYWNERGRNFLTSADPIFPTVWNTIAVEYRAEGVCLLYVNGKSVASVHGRGPLAPGGDELWFGRYYWKDPKDEKEYKQWMRGAVAAPKLTVLDDDAFPVDLSDLNNAMHVSWGDFIVVGEGWKKLNKPEHVKILVDRFKKLGVKKVYWRCSHEFIMNFCERRMDEDHWYIKAYNSANPAIHEEVLRQCHEAGMKVYAWSTIFDEGSPTSYLYGGSSPFFWQSHFTIENPHCVVENRDGTKRQWGVMCYAYPEAREHAINVFKHMMEKWDFDGLYICTRTHSLRSEFADEFGYNQPIVDEFKRRHDVDIRTEEFSRTQWNDLQGEYLTQLLREFRAAFPDKGIDIGIPRSDTIGPPYGNMRLDWRTWVGQGLIDGLRIGTISGAFHYPNSRDKPGYIQSQQDSLHMRELEYDLGEWFGPACEEAGVELYFDRGAIYSDKDRELLDFPGVTGFSIGFH